MLTDVAGRLGQKFKWDPKREEFIGHDEANRLLRPQKHNGWKL